MTSKPTKIAGRPTEWTFEKAQAFASDVLTYVKDHPTCYTIGEACSELGWYEDILGHIQRSHKCQFEDILLSKEILKARCIKMGMMNITNATMTIFNLVNNYDMVNTNVKSDITSKGEQVRSIPAISWVTGEIEQPEEDNQKLLSNEQNPKND